MKQLDPKAVWLFFFNSSIGIIFLTLLLWFFFNIFLRANELEKILQVVGLPGIISIFNFWWIVILFLVLVYYMWANLTYHFYRYELREDGFRKEHGVIWKKYVTISYERIQNVDIYRGLLARLLGLSDLNIQTAGMSTTVGSYGGGSEGRLPGLSPEVAEQLRDELIHRARGKHQGL